MMTLQGKTVLVTGATGFLGGALCHRLAADGAHVKALARRPERDRYIREIANLDIVMGDITDERRMHEIIAGCDVVFHAAAALGGPLDHQRHVNVEGTRSVMTAAASSGVQRVVHISTISVYGYKNAGDVTEDTLPNPGHDAYHISKAEAEAVVREVGTVHRMAYTILRPGMIYGPRSNMWTRRVFQLARRKPTPFIGSGSGSAYPIYIDDVVDLSISAALHPAAENQLFNCTPDPSPTVREFLGAYSRLAGHDRWLSIPSALARPLAALIAITAPAQSPRKDAVDALALIQRRVTYKMDKARDLLGWQPKISLQEGVARCAPWLREKGLLR